MSESVNLPESVQTEIMAAWEQQLLEAKQAQEAELREEYAAKYEHDKAQIVESLDQFVTSKLTLELEEFSKDKVALAHERVAIKEQAKSQMAKFASFIKENLDKEVAEFRKERKLMESKLSVMEHFVSRKLYEEISEFEQDKREVIAEKVRLVAEGKRQILEAKNAFLLKASKLVAERSRNILSREIKTLKEDIQRANENQFGRKIFETFASEFMATHLNENKELNKLKRSLSEATEKLGQLNESLVAQEQETKRVKRVLAESKIMGQRNKALSELLKPLNPQKRKVMESLLENVSTERLPDMFKKYLPVVLEGKDNTKEGNKVLSESCVAVTGNRASRALPGDNAETNDIVELRKLAGLDK